MAGNGYSIDPRIRRKHVPLFSQQRRLRHLRNIGARNVTVDVNASGSSAIGLYFTLHQATDSPEFYKSETVYECLNPSWRSFEASAFTEDVNHAASSVVVKLWVSTEEIPSSCITEWIVHFSGLTYLGNQVPKDGKKFRPNSLLFGMFEGFYSSSDCFQLPLSEHPESIIHEMVPVEASSVRTSYCVNTLYRIQMIQQVIKHTQASVKKTRAALEEQLYKALDKREKRAQRETLKMKVDILQNELNARQAALEALKEQKALLEENIQDKGMELLTNYQQLAKEREHLRVKRKHLDETRETLLKTKAQLLLRRKQLITELSQIYPIVQFPDKKGYSIGGVHLPNAEDFAGHDDTMISVALGYVCHLLVMISRFLNVPLRYPIRYFGSHSTICDQVTNKVPDNNRDFPLYSKGRDKTRFNYGVFLLNKNISQLRHYCALSTEDLRTTLPNLHNLIETRLSIRSEQGSSYILTPGMQHPSNPSTVFPVSIPEVALPYPSGPSSILPMQNGLSVNHTALNDQQLRTPEGMIDSKKPGEGITQYFNGSKISETLPRRKLFREKPHMDPLAKRSGPCCSNLSCSLDKGLNEIKYLQQCMRLSPSGSNNSELQARMHVCSLGHRNHHSSVPNLASCSASPSVLEDEAQDVRQLRPLPITHKMWSTYSSQGNSDDENLLALRVNSPGIDGATTLSCSPADSGTSGEDFKTKVSDDQCDERENCSQDSGAVAGVSSAGFQESTFDMDLALRTERLASASGSFQLQKPQNSTVSVNAE